MTKREVDSEPDKAEAEHSGTLAVTGETDTAPATASEGKGESALPTVSGAGAGEWNNLLVRQIAQVSAGNALAGTNEARKRTRGGLAVMAGIAPSDVIEDMAAAQLLAAHLAAMECYQRAAVPDQPFEAWRESLSQANRLSRTFATLMEAVNRHRGKSGQQTVRVEHVTVNEGGQAVVGAVERPGGRGGEDDPFGEGLPHARGAPVRCKDAARDAMQGPRDARPEALPDARRPIARSAAWQPPQLAARPLFPRGDRAAARGCRADPGNAFADASARGVTGIRWLHIAQCWAGACSWAAFSHWSPSFPAGEFWKQPSYQRSLIRTHAPICACRGT